MQTSNLWLNMPMLHQIQTPHDMKPTAFLLPEYVTLPTLWQICATNCSSSNKHPRQCSPRIFCPKWPPKGSITELTLCSPDQDLNLRSLAYYAGTLTNTKSAWYENHYITDRHLSSVKRVISLSACVHTFDQMNHTKGMKLEQKLLCLAWRE